MKQGGCSSPDHVVRSDHLAVFIADFSFFLISCVLISREKYQWSTNWLKKQVLREAYRNRICHVQKCLWLKNTLDTFSFSPYISRTRWPIVNNSSEDKIGRDASEPAETTTVCSVSYKSPLSAYQVSDTRPAFTWSYSVPYSVLPACEGSAVSCNIRTVELTTFHSDPRKETCIKKGTRPVKILCHKELNIKNFQMKENLYKIR